MRSINKTINVALVGVGGQGILLASEVISRAAMLSGLDVKKSEVHGMAQRGGSVISEVRFGPKVYSPLIPQGETDYLISFELLESLRYADLLAADGEALINRQMITPITVSSGQQQPLDDLLGRIDRAFPKRRIIDAMEIAENLGNIRAANIIMTGALAGLLELDETIWVQAIRELVKPQFVELNIAAFDAGRKLVDTCAV